MSESTAPNRWLDQKRIAGLRKWHVLWEEFSRELAEVFVRALPPGTRAVLDLASGTGEPAFSIAASLGTGGSVVLTDLAAEVLEIARESARARGITNVSYRECVLPVIPFADESFDAVTCRFGIMFVPDAVEALRQCRRVLRPGGRALFLVWRDPDQPFWAGTVGELRKYAEIPPESPELLSPFRFQHAGMLKRVFQDAGFADCLEEAIEVKLHWKGTPQMLAEYFVEFSGFYRPYLDSLTPETLGRLQHGIESGFAAYVQSDELTMAGRVALVTGVRA